MKLTVVGCSGSLPGPDSPASCYVVQTGGTTLVLDLGSGAIGPLQRVVDLGAVDAVLLSHLHPDHCLDLCGYYVAVRYGPWPARAQLPVFGPVGTAERLARAYAVDGARDLGEAFDIQEYPRGAFRIGDIAVTAARVAHRTDEDPDWMEAYAIRVAADGAVIAYSGDTGRCDSVIELAAGADVFLCEASNANGVPSAPNLHVSGRDAGEIARAAGAGRLVLTHIPPWGDPDAARAAAAEAFTAGDVTVAHPGMITSTP